MQAFIRIFIKNYKNETSKNICSYIRSNVSINDYCSKFKIV